MIGRWHPGVVGGGGGDGRVVVVGGRGHGGVGLRRRGGRPLGDRPRKKNQRGKRKRTGFYRTKGKMQGSVGKKQASVALAAAPAAVHTPTGIEGGAGRKIGRGRKGRWVCGRFTTDRDARVDGRRRSRQRNQRLRCPNRPLYLLDVLLAGLLAAAQPNASRPRGRDECLRRPPLTRQ